MFYRLGSMWKIMSKEAKEKYFVLAKEVDAEHKRKYPGKLICILLSLFFEVKCKYIYIIFTIRSFPVCGFCSDNGSYI